MNDWQESPADFSAMLAEDEKIVCQDRFDGSFQTKYLIKHWIKAAVSFGIAVYGTVFGFRHIEKNIYALFPATGLFIIVLIAALVGKSAVKRIIKAGKMEYAVTDQRIITYDKNGYTSFMYYGMEFVGPVGKVWCDVGQLEAWFSTDAVICNEPRPMSGKRYRLRLLKVNDPCIVCGHIGKFTGVGTPTIDMLYDPPPSDFGSD